MPAGLWRALAIAFGVLSLFSVLIDSFDGRVRSDNHISSTSVDPGTYEPSRVVAVTGTPAENGGLLPGDIIRPAGPLNMRDEQGDSLVGTRLAWDVQRGAKHFVTTSIVTTYSNNTFLLFEIFNVIRFAMIFIGIVIAVRRPDDKPARALVTFLIALGMTLVAGGAWLADPAYLVWRVLRNPLQNLALAQCVIYACIFPALPEHGFRRWLHRVNPWFAVFVSIVSITSTIYQDVHFASLPLGPFQFFFDWCGMLLVVGIFAGYWAAIAETHGTDRQRVVWAAGSICVGFLGPVIVTVLTSGMHVRQTWVPFLALSLVAMPFGLAYTILRHRTVDVGFVISRALVLTILSFIIVAIFGLLERALGKIFIDASHVASRSVEIALALGLGFSMRSLHARVEKIVDRLFFRQRRRALASLRAFANDVYFITDPAIAVDRTVAVTGIAADAESAAMYSGDGNLFRRVGTTDAGAFPDEVDENDTALVRMRASRQTELVRGLGSAFPAEIAFPMFVRGALAGALVLAAKRTGEAYDPEETALLADVAQRAGIALDALQTVALRRELEELVRATGGVAPAF